MTKTHFIQLYSRENIEEKVLSAAHNKHEGWRSEPCLKHSLIDRSACTLPRNHMECNWSKHRTSQRPRIDFHVSVMATHAGIDLPAYITALLFSSLSCPALHHASSPPHSGQNSLHWTHSRLYNFRNYSSSWNNWEAMICIYIRSLDQARGLLAQGTLVSPSAVSSDSQHVSSGNLCTACIRQLSLSTSKLSGTSQSFSLFVPFFGLIMCLISVLLCHVGLALSLPSSLCVPSQQHGTISVSCIIMKF